MCILYNFIKYAHACTKNYDFACLFPNVCFDLLGVN